MSLITWLALGVFLVPCLSLTILTAIFTGKPGLAGFIGAKDGGSGGDNWSYMTCKAPVKCHHQQTSTHVLRTKPGLGISCTGFPLCLQFIWLTFTLLL